MPNSAAATLSFVEADAPEIHNSESALVSATDKQRLKYEAHFRSLAQGEEQVSEEAARVFYARAEVPEPWLDEIWNFVSGGKPTVGVQDFSAGLHLVYSALKVKMANPEKAEAALKKAQEQQQQQQRQAQQQPAPQTHQAALHASVASAETQAEVAKAELASAKASAAEAQAAASALASKRDEALKAAAAAREELQAEEAKRAAAVKAKEEAEKAVAQAKAQAEEASTALEAMRSEIAEAKNILSTAESASAAARKEAEELEAQRVGAAAELDELKARVADAQEAAAASNAAKETASAALAGLQEQAEQAHGDLAIAEKSRSEAASAGEEMVAKVKALEAEVAELRRAVGDATSASATDSELEVRIAKLQSEKDELHRLQESVKENTAARTELVEAAAAQEAAADSAAAAAAAAMTALAEARERRDAAASARADAERRRDEANASIATLDNEASKDEAAAAEAMKEASGVQSPFASNVDPFSPMAATEIAPTTAAAVMGESPFGSAFSPSGSDMPGDFGGFGSAAAALPEAKSPEDLDAFGFGATTKPQSADAAAVEADEDTEDPFAAPSADKDMKIDTPVSAFPDAGFTSFDNPMASTTDDNDAGFTTFDNPMASTTMDDGKTDGFAGAGFTAFDNPMAATDGFDVNPFGSESEPTKVPAEQAAAGDLDANPFDTAGDGGMSGFGAPAMPPFETVDANHDGVITRDEYEAAASASASAGAPPMGFTSFENPMADAEAMSSVQPPIPQRRPPPAPPTLPPGMKAMGASDKGKVNEAFARIAVDDRIPVDAARKLFDRTKLDTGVFSHIWALTGAGAKTSLSLLQFTFYMYLLKVSVKRNNDLPADIAPESIAMILGVSVEDWADAVGVTAFPASVEGDIASASTKAPMRAPPAPPPPVSEVAFDPSPPASFGDPASAGGFQASFDGGDMGGFGAFGENPFPSVDEHSAAAAAPVTFTNSAAPEYPPPSFEPAFGEPAAAASFDPSFDDFQQPPLQQPAPPMYAEAAAATAAPPPPLAAAAASGAPEPGSERVVLKLDKIKVGKIASKMQRTVCTVSIRDLRTGEPLPGEQPQTPMALSGVEGYVVFTADVKLSTPLSELPMDAYVCFELKHWKEWKKKMSLKAWSFLPVSKLLESLMSPRSSPMDAVDLPLPLLRKPSVYDSVGLSKAKPFNRLALDVHMKVAIA